MKEWITSKEFASILRLYPKTPEQWRHRGVGPPYHKAGRSVRYWWPEVVAWIGLTSMALPGIKPGMTGVEQMEAVLGKKKPQGGLQ